MRLEQVKEIANAVLYEGYLLYPYRQSAIKNRTRWTFGVVYPRAYSEAQGGFDPWTMHTECLLEGEPERTTLDITIRFLHLLVRTIIQHNAPGAQPEEEAEHEWGLASHFSDEPLQEGSEREIQIAGLAIQDLLTVPKHVAIAFPATSKSEDLPGTPAREVRREQQALTGVVKISAERIAAGIFKISATIENTTPDTGAVTDRRDAILFHSFISTHTLFQVQQGAFISLLEPPLEQQELVRSCHNQRTWPVLVGEPGVCNTLLSSPIILYDYPQIAPESPGPLFDGSEIDEILSLRILTLSNEEKEQMRQDEHTRAILERTEALTPDQFMHMHGTMRNWRPISEGGQI